MTKLIAENHESPLCDPIVLAAGNDITHWFDQTKREPKKFIDKDTNQETAYCPTGRYLHVPPVNATSNSGSEVAPFSIPWWNDTERYCIGRLTKKVR